MADVFRSSLSWTGAAKGPTTDPATFSRDLDAGVADTTLAMSAAPQYRGDPSRVNPEQLLVTAVSACQALTYLSLAARKGVAVVGYSDEAEGRLVLQDGWLRMSNVVLRPVIALASAADEDLARVLIQKAHRACIIANSVSADIAIEPRFVCAEVPTGVAA
jgi:organic hydroperoxide reductase OsmC/OhrA